MTNLANLAKYIGHSEWSSKLEEQTPVTTEPQMVATYKQEKPQAQGPADLPVNSETVHSCSGFIELRRWISRIFYK